MKMLVLRNTMKKRIFITLLPLLSVLCLLTLIGICETFIERSSFLYDFLSVFSLVFFFPMIIGLPFTIKVNREKIKYDGYYLYITPFIGRTKELPLVEVGLAVIDSKNYVKLFNENGNKLCKYHKEQDFQGILLADLDRAGVPIVEYSYSAKAMLELPIEERQSGEKQSEERKDDAGEGFLEIYGFKEKIYDKEDIDINIAKALEKTDRKILFVGYGAMLIIYGGLIRIAKLVNEFAYESFVAAISCLVLYTVVAAGFCILFDYFFKWKRFNILKPTYSKVSVKPIGMIKIKDGKTIARRHMLYEFTDRNGQIRHRASDVQLTENVKEWDLNSQKTVMWYSPYADYLIPDDSLMFSFKGKNERLTLMEWMKKNPIGMTIMVAIIAITMFSVTNVQKEMSYKPEVEESPLKVEWADEGADLSAEVDAAIASTGMDKETYEEWLKQTYYPYFRVNKGGGKIFINFDVETYNDNAEECRTEDIRENIEENWGITDRKTLIETTDSLLDKGAKYGYKRTINRMGEEVLDMSEEEIQDKYGERDSYYQYLGCYLAHKNIPEVGLDGWDYGRCIRLYACGYICGYISYEEYLIHSVPVALQIQEEFESWTHMYESYYYGYLYFLGRNDYNDKSALMWGYANYGIFESCLFVPLKAE